MDSRDRRVLAIETITATPHTETTIEILWAYHEVGVPTFYCPLFESLLNRYFYTPPGGLSKAPNGTTWLTYAVENLPYDTVIIPMSFKLHDRSHVVSKRNVQDIDSLQYDALPFGELIRKFVYESKMLDVRLLCGEASENLSVFLNHLYTQSILVYRASVSLLEQIRPTDIVVFNGRTPTTCPVVWAARKFGAKVHFHERGPDHTKYEIFSSQPSLPDTLHQRITSFSIYRHPVVAERSAGVFYSRLMNHQPKSWHSFSAEQAKFESPLELAVAENYCVFFLSSNREIDAVPGYDISGYLGDQYETIELVCKACKALNMELYVRAHPNQSKDLEEITRIKSICRKYDTSLILPESQINSLKLGKMASRILTFGSTLTWQLMFLGCRVGILCESIGKDHHGVENLKSHEDLISFLSNPTYRCERTFAISYGDYMESGGYPFFRFKPVSLFEGNFER